MPGELTRGSAPDEADPDGVVWEPGSFEIRANWPLCDGGFVRLHVDTNHLGLTSENLRQLAEVVDGIAAFRADVGHALEVPHG